MIWVNPKLVIFCCFFHCNSHHKKIKLKKYAVPQGNTWVSLLSTCDFHRKMNKIQNKQNVAKGKQRGRYGVAIKQEDVLQAVVRKTLIGYHNSFFKYRTIREYIFKISNLDFPCYYFWVHATVFKSNVNLASTFERWSSHFEMESEVVFCPIRI
jgi:hypothetical protein